VNGGIMNSLQYLKLNVTMVCYEKCTLPPYLGSTLRGALGNVLRELSCSSGQDDCSKCHNKLVCPYTYCFSYHNPEQEGWMKGIETKPNPFVIEPPLNGKTRYLPKDTLQFGILLIERSIDFLPYFIVSLQKMGDNGLGFRRGRFELVKVENESTGDIIFEKEHFNIVEPQRILWSDETGKYPAEELSLYFLTPFRFKMEGKIYDSLNFEIIMRNIFRRASMLAASYGNKVWELNYKSFLEDARQIAIKKADLRWYDWERYSNRTQCRIAMGGIKGEIIFKGNLTPFIPFIQLGSIIHIGKACTMGLGKYYYKIE